MFPQTFLTAERLTYAIKKLTQEQNKNLINLLSNRLFLDNFLWNDLVEKRTRDKAIIEILTDKTLKHLLMNSFLFGKTKEEASLHYKSIGEPARTYVKNFNTIELLKIMNAIDKIKENYKKNNLYYQETIKNNKEIIEKSEKQVTRDIDLIEKESNKRLTIKTSLLELEQNIIEIEKEIHEINANPQKRQEDIEHSKIVGLNDSIDAIKSTIKEKTKEINYLEKKLKILHKDKKEKIQKIMDSNTLIDILEDERKGHDDRERFEINALLGKTINSKESSINDYHLKKQKFSHAFKLKYQEEIIRTIEKILLQKEIKLDKDLILTCLNIILNELTEQPIYVTAIWMTFIKHTEACYIGNEPGLYLLEELLETMLVPTVLHCSSFSKHRIFLDQIFFGLPERAIELFLPEVIEKTVNNQLDKTKEAQREEQTETESPIILSSTGTHLYGFYSGNSSQPKTTDEMHQGTTSNKMNCPGNLSQS